MHSPGIEVQPIVTIDCPPEGHQEINMVHFTDVKVPVENLIGEEKKRFGWIFSHRKNYDLLEAVFSCFCVPQEVLDPQNRAKTP